jgi:hypothetical protein
MLYRLEFRNYELLYDSDWDLVTVYDNTVEDDAVYTQSRRIKSVTIEILKGAFPLKDIGELITEIENRWKKSPTDIYMTDLHLQLLVLTALYREYGTALFFFPV